MVNKNKEPKKVIPFLSKENRLINNLSDRIIFYWYILCHIRIKNHMTPDYAASKLQISLDRYLQIEAGISNPDLRIAVRIAKLFQLNYKDLFFFSDLTNCGEIQLQISIDAPDILSLLDSL